MRLPRRTPAAARPRRRLGSRLSAPALAFAGGVLAALAHPPFGVLPAVFGYALVLVALDRPTPGPRRGWPAFARGWAAGTGYLLVSTVWIVEPFMIDAAAHAWQAPFAVLWCAAGIGSLWGAAGWMYAWLAPPDAEPRRPALSAAARVAAFAACFGLWEWLRGHALTGFPWDLPGETWRAGSPASQGAALVGAYGMTFATLAFGAAPAVLSMPGALARRLLVLAVTTGLFASASAWGAQRLRRPLPPPPGAPLRVRIVQPNLPEPAGWSPGIVRHALDLYTGLTRTPAPAGGRPDLVIWPEGAIPDSFNSYLAPGTDSLAQVAAALQPGQQLLVGGYRGVSKPQGPVYYNSLAALRRTSGGLALEGVYDKHHLVPFGEYLPMASLFTALGMRKLVSVGPDFAPGPPPRAMTLARPGGPLRLQPLICYEALFPGIAEDSLAHEGRGGRTALIVNVSDDAWFGRASGPWQHLNIASYRAIEEGLPMVRATPTGVSAVIDAFGRPASRLLGPGEAGVIDAAAPPALRPTPYARWRDRPFWAAELAALAFALTLGRRRSRDRGWLLR